MLSALSGVRLAGIRARASGRPDELRAAAEQHRAAGLVGHARGLAAPAVAGTTTLTRREREIARMAAQGLTDKEIAASLVVSVRTVESHLTAAYRKLDIRSRRELSDLLRG